MIWQDVANCRGQDPEWFYDTYEEKPEIRKPVDSICMQCPVQRECFYTGVSSKDWGVWGGVYLQDGEIDTTFNNHKTGEDWADLWESLTMEKNVLY